MSSHHADIYRTLPVEFTIAEITRQVLATAPGKAGCVADVLFCREGDRFIVEGTKNKLVAWNLAVAAIAKRAKVRS